MRALFVGLAFFVSSFGFAQADNLTQITLSLPPANFSQPFEYSPGDSSQPSFLTSWTYRDKLYGFMFYRIDDQTGKLMTRFRVTNGKRWRGFTVCASVVFRDDDTKLILASNFKFGVNPKKDRDETRTYNVDPAIWKQMDKVEVYWTRCSTNKALADLVLRGMAFAAGQIVSGAGQ